MTGARIAVALPVRNGADFLAAALESILDQDLADFALFVSDNASTDATPDILADYAARDPRVRVFRSEAPLSQVENMNRAVALAEAPWVKLFCHDDLMRRDCLAQVAAAVAIFDSTPVALIGNGERHLFGQRLAGGESDGSPQRIAGHEAVRGFLAGRMQGFDIPAVTNATVRKATFEAMGGFDPRWVHFDIFAWLELLMRDDLGWIPSPLTVNRIHPAQVAVVARGELRSVADYRGFLGDFVARHRTELDLPFRSRLRTRALPLSIAAVALAGEVMKGSPDQALRLARRLPPLWWPAMPVLTWRALRQARAHAAAIPDIAADAFRP